jgi:hypothetical protein
MTDVTTDRTRVEMTRQADVAGDAPQPTARAVREPNGGIAAALLAAGTACALLGVLVVASEASEGFRELMTIYEPAGPLSGKTTVPSVVWLAAWALLHQRLKKRNVDIRKSIYVTWVLVAMGLLGTFPPFFQLFAE